MTVKLLKASIEDVPLISQLENKSFQCDQISIKNLIKFCNNPRADFIVIKENEFFAGYGLVLHRRNTKKARLYSIAIDPHFKNRGFGQKILNHLEKLAKEREATSMILEVASKNISAQNFYRNLEYKEYRYRKEYYSDHDDAICLEKIL